MDRLDLDERARDTLSQMMSDWGAPECEAHDRNVAIFRGEGRSAAVVVADPKQKESEVAALLEAAETEMREAVHRSVVISKDPRKRYKLRAAVVFSEPELYFNRSRHPDAQSYALLSPEEVHSLCSAFDVTVDKLPVMYAADPQARYRGYAGGDVVRVTRNTDNGLMTHYRRVVA